MLNWNDYKNFNKAEFDCKETGQNRMRHEYMEFIQQVRIIYAKPMIVNSGFRAETHSMEVGKDYIGEHTLGLAGDYRAIGEDLLRLSSIAYGLGAKRIGFYQNNSQKFIHIGLGDQLADFPPVPWTP